MRHVVARITKTTLKLVSVSVMALMPLTAVPLVSAESQFPELISVSANGEVSDKGSGDTENSVQISDDGRYVAYASRSNNLVGQRPDAEAIYVYDRIEKTTTLASINSNGQQENGTLLRFELSGDGRHVVFSTSGATNMDPNAAPGSVYVHNLNAGTTTMVSVDNNGQGINANQIASISYDGSVVAFSDHATLYRTMYTRDVANGVTEQLSEQIYSAGDVGPVVSSDGSKVLYTSRDSSQPTQVKVYDRNTSASTTVSVLPNGSPSEEDTWHSDISAGGRYVAFYSFRDFLPGDPEECAPIKAADCIYRRDMVEGTTERVDTRATDISDHEISYDVISLSADGSVIAFVYYDLDLQSPSGAQVAVHDFKTGNTRLASVNSEGESASMGDLQPVATVASASNPSLNGDGTLIAFRTNAPNFGLPVFEYNRHGVDGYLRAHSQAFVTATDPDSMDPTISYELSPAPNVSGWHSGDVTVTFTCEDAESGIASCTEPVVVTAEGDNMQVTGTAVDLAGNTATTTATVQLDKTIPTIGTPTMSGIVLGILLGSTTNISATVADTLSGVVRAEYYFDIDPGQGNGATMNLSDNPTTNGTTTAIADVSDLGTGQHTLYVRSQDAAGHWSTVASSTFVRLF